MMIDVMDITSDATLKEECCRVNSVSGPMEEFASNGAEVPMEVP